MFNIARPKALDDITLETDLIINKDEFVKAYKGKIDSQGRIPTVGFPEHEVLVFIKKQGDKNSIQN